MALTLIVTNAGRAALINAPNTGTAAVTITHVGVSPTAVVPAKTATTLPGEVKRITTFGGAATAADVINVTVSDESTDTYTVRSFALYLNDGTLFAIYGQPTPIIEKSSAAQLLLPIDVTLVDISATSIQFGSVGLVNPAATTETAGVVERATDAEALALADKLRFLTPDQIGKIFTATNILSRLLTADGAGSGLDADLLDGLHSSAFAQVIGADFTGGVRVRPAAPTVVNNLATYPLSIGYNGATLLSFGADAARTYLQSWGGQPLAINTQGNGIELGSATSVTGTLRVTGAITRAGSTVWDAANDGSGSGLDADLLDGLHAGAFAQLTGADFTGDVTFRSVLRSQNFGSAQGQIVGGTEFYSRAIASNWWAGVRAYVPEGAQGVDFVELRFYTSSNERMRITSAGAVGIGTASPAAMLDVAGTLSASGAIKQNGNQVWHVGNDGAGSGLDADLLDGLQAGAFAQLSGAVFTGPVSFDAGLQLYSQNANYSVSRVGTQSVLSSADVVVLRTTASQSWLNLNANGLLQHVQGGSVLWASTNAAFSVNGSLAASVAITRAGNTVWDAGNDGSGSGLDADLLDGLQAAAFAQLTGAVFTGTVDAQTPNNGTSGGVRIRANATSTNAYLQFVNAAGNAELGNIRVGANGAFNVSGPISRAGNTVWDAANDGSGSGLDADLLDGRHASEFALLSAFSGSFNANGYITLPGGLLLQWATGAQMSSETSQAINWPVPFPNACFARFVSTDIAFASTVANSGYQTIDDSTATRRSTVTVYRQRYSESGGDSTASWPVVIGLGR